MPCTLSSFAATNRQTAELAALIDAAFAQYEGVIRADGEFVAWYLRRPGLGPEHALVFTVDGALAANLFVTLTELRFGGETLTAGVIDTVCTHPDHRRRGLARELMHAAIDLLQRKGADLSLLYTQPDSVPCRFYETLGYRGHVRINAFRGEVRTGALSGGSHAEPVSAAHARAAVDERLSIRDGHIPLADELWAWRRLERPASLPVRHYVTCGGEVAAAVCTCHVVTEGVARPANILTEVAAAESAPLRQGLTALLSRLDPALPVTWLVADCNRREREAALALGFQSLPECAMVLPLSPRGEAAARRPVAEWYTLTESVVGV